MARFFRFLVSRFTFAVSRFTFLFTILSSSLWRVESPAAPLAPAYIEGEVIVTFKESADLAAAKRVNDAHSLIVGQHYGPLSEWRHRQTFLLRGNGRSTRQLIGELQREPSVETVEPNYLRFTDGQPPNDALFSQLWGLNNSAQEVDGFSGTAGDDIKFLNAWSLARPSPTNVVVAVVDSGVDYHHPDLAGNMWTNPG